LHPAVNVKMNNVKMSLVLLRFGFNGFKVALLACQNFSAKASTIWAGYFFSKRVIFLETCHALHFGRYKTEAQLRMFRRGALAEFFPMGLQGGWVKFRDLAEGDVNCCDTFCVAHMRLTIRFIDKCLDDVWFTHAVFNKTPQASL
jgi:hypothetical protein